jgi:hypothetical protein
MEMDPIYQITMTILLMTKKLSTTTPPKKGPVSQGLNIQYNTVRTVKQSGEKINGRYRQSSSKRRANN